VVRSLKKNPFVANHLLKKIEKVNTKAEKEIIELGPALQPLYPQ